MPSYTDNHAFQLFADDETPWEHRTDFEKLDNRTPIVDANSNRFNYSAKTNAIFLASDTADLYLGTGASWNHLGTIGGGGDGTIAVQDSGTAVGDATELNFNNNLTASVSNGVASIDASGSGGEIGSSITGPLEITGQYREHLKLHRDSITSEITTTLQGDNGGLQIGVSSLADGTVAGDEYKASFIKKEAEGDNFPNLYLNDGQSRVWHEGNFDPSQTGSGSSAVLNSHLTIYVDPNSGSDSASGSQSDPVATIQEAVDRVPPINPRYGIRVYLQPGTYDEDVVVGPYISGAADGGSFRIVGDRSNPGDYQVGSMIIHGCHAINAASVWGMTFTRQNSMISTGSPLFVYASTNVEVDGVQFNPSSGSFEVGVEFYGGTTGFAQNVDVSGTDMGIKAKGEATVSCEEITGTANQYPYWATEASKIHWRFSSASAGSTSSYFDLVQLDNGSQAFSRNGTFLKNLEVGGTIDATSSKNFVEKLDDGREVVYTAQEGGGVRAVHEGRATLSKGSTVVDLPEHFSLVASESEPELRVQVTPRELATVAVTERSTEQLTIESDAGVDVDYRATAIRDGHEDKEIIREQGS